MDILMEESTSEDTRKVERIEIWAPKYCDDTVLIACRRVTKGVDYEIVFTKAKHLIGSVFGISGEEIMNWPITSNGKIKVYAVPMDVLRRIR